MYPVEARCGTGYVFQSKAILCMIGVKERHGMIFIESENPHLDVSNLVLVNALMKIHDSFVHHMDSSCVTGSKARDWD